MKRRKEGWICLLGAALALCLCSCGSHSEPGRKLRKEGQLYVSTSACFPPYEYYAGDQIEGADVEIVQTIADRMGLELKMQDMLFDDVIDSVKNGENDMAIAALSITQERKALVDFSDPYAYGIQSIIVKEDGPIKGTGDLANAEKIGVHKGSTGESYCISDFGEDKVASYHKINTALLDLNLGKLDAIVIDQDVALKYVEDNVGLKVLDTEYVKEEYGIAFCKGNAPLRDEINEILGEMKESGELEAILNKYVITL